MCFNPVRVMAYEYIVDTVPKKLLFFSATAMDFMSGSVTITKSDVKRLSQRNLTQMRRDHLTLPITFDKRLELPCGHCSDCCRAKAKEWSVRCELESKLSPHNYFVTLTYNEECVPREFWTSFNPDNGDECHRYCRRSLRFEDISKFMKALRQYFKRNFEEDGIRFLACSEYGGKSHRPHYHMILFNCNLRDLRPWNKSKTGKQMFRSAILENLWKKGFITVQPYSQECARYVAQYTLKKMKKSEAPLEHCEPEALNMSRRPGIGNLWFLQNCDKLFRPIVDKTSVHFSDRIPLAFVDPKTQLPVVHYYKCPSSFIRQFKRVSDIKRGVYNERGKLSDLVFAYDDVLIDGETLYYYVYRPYIERMSAVLRETYLRSLGSSYEEYIFDCEFRRVNRQKQYLNRFFVKRDLTDAPGSDIIELKDLPPVRKKRIFDSEQICLFESEV